MLKAVQHKLVNLEQQRSVVLDLAVVTTASPALQYFTELSVNANLGTLVNIVVT